MKKLTLAALGMITGLLTTTTTFADFKTPSGNIGCSPKAMKLFV